jgi:hypothetical protein
MLKTKTERVLLLAVAFLAGCEAERLANVAVPPAYAGVPIQRWEYACTKPYNFTGVGPGDVASEANKYGQQGWELSASDSGGIWCFKRPLGAAAAAPVSAQ